MATTIQRLLAIGMMAGESVTELNRIQHANALKTDSLEASLSKQFDSLFTHAARWNDLLVERMNVQRDIIYRSTGIPPSIVGVDFINIGSIADLEIADNAAINPPCTIGLLVANYWIEPIILLEMALISASLASSS